MTKIALSPEVLRQLLRYEPETGKMYWRERPNAQFSAKFANTEAGRVDRKGYVKISVLGVSLRGHRVVWALSFGEWPSEDIDHINGQRSDNRIANLRLAGPDQNNKNRAVSKNSKTGIIGVMRFGRRWRANIWHAGRNVYLGTFPCIGRAIRMRRDAQRALGFHPNHGAR